jgi:hypothetical protein
VPVTCMCSPEHHAPWLFAGLPQRVERCPKRSVGAGRFCQLGEVLCHEEGGVSDPMPLSKHQIEGGQRSVSK